MKLKIILLLLFIIAINRANGQTWSLEQCIDTALVNNKKLKIDQNNIRLGEAKQKEVKSNLLPKIKGSVDYKYFFDQPTQLMPAHALNPMAPEWQFNSLQFGVPHNINANVQLGMPLYNATLLSNIKMTEIASELKELQYQRTQEEVYVTVSDLYYNAQVIRNQIVFMDANIVNTEKLLNNLKLLKEQQIATGTDVNKIDLQLQQLQSQKQVLLSKYQQVLDGLKINIGVENLKFDVISEINYSKALNYNKNTLTDIKMVETKQKLIDREIKTLKRGLLPSVMLYGSYGTTGYGYDETPNDFLDFYDVSFAGLKIEIPVFDISRKHQITQKKIERENVELQLGLLGEQNTIQIDGAKRQVSITQQTIMNTKGQISLAQSIYDNTLLQHKQEMASITDVLLADNNLRQAQQSYLAAVINYLKADLELKKLTGNLIK
jgi:OMF family outer membrane factor